MNRKMWFNFKLSTFPKQVNRLKICGCLADANDVKVTSSVVNASCAKRNHQHMNLRQTQSRTHKGVRIHAPWTVAPHLFTRTVNLRHCSMRFCPKRHWCPICPLSSLLIEAIGGHWKTSSQMDWKNKNGKIDLGWPQIGDLTSANWESQWIRHKKGFLIRGQKRPKITVNKYCDYQIAYSKTLYTKLTHFLGWDHRTVEY